MKVLFWSVLYQEDILTSFQRGLVMLSTECTVTESLLCNLKWLLLSSRLQASCCPRCWSLRSKMRLLQCCEWADTGEEEGIKELPALCSVPLIRARTSLFYFFFLFPAAVSLQFWGHFLFKTCCCLQASRCGALYCVTQIAITCKAHSV